MRKNSTSRIRILSVPYEERQIAQAAGARWDSALRHYVYDGGGALPHALKLYASSPYSWERWREDDVNGRILKVPKSDPTQTLKPRKHQQEAINTILRAAKGGARGFLLADDVGVGKTLSAAIAVARMNNIRTAKKILIVCPLSVVPHWRRTLQEIDTEPDVRFCVINYDRLKHLLKTPESAKKAKRRSTQNRRIVKDGENLVDWDVIIFDESHQLKNKDAQRSIAAARIARYHLPAKQAPFVIWMSATAGQNPTELSYLAPLLAQVTGSRASSLKDFGPWLKAQGFHVTEDTRWGGKWTWSDEPQERKKDIVLMSRLLFERKTPVAMRRLPTDIAGWPEVQRILLPVDLSIVSRAKYLKAWTDFRREMHLIQRGKNPKGGLVVQLRFRQKASLLRIDGTVGQAMNLLDNGHQVAISIQFLETLDAIQEQLTKNKIKVSVMDGRNPSGREAERLAFQRGETKVMLFTPVEGFSLHQNEMLAGGEMATNIPRSLIIHDPRYSGIQGIQIEGRCILEGQKVHTENGLVPIEQIKIGDCVLTQSGEKHPVVDAWNSSAEGKILTEITHKGSSRDKKTLVSTNDHPIFVKRNNVGQWLAADEIKPGDHLALPKSSHVLATSANGVEDKLSFYYWRKVVKTTSRAGTFREKVWDLSIDEVPSYVVESALVHNCHRDGQLAKVYYAFSTDTVEEKVVSTLLGRMETTKSMVGDDTTLIQELENILEKG